MWKGIVKNQAKYKQAVKYFLKTNKTSNEFIFTLLYQLYFFWSTHYSAYFFTIQ